MSNAILAAARAASLILADADAKGLPQPGCVMLAQDTARVNLTFDTIGDLTEWAVEYEMQVSGDPINNGGMKHFAATGFPLDHAVRAEVWVLAEPVNR